MHGRHALLRRLLSFEGFEAPGGEQRGCSEGVGAGAPGEGLDCLGVGRPGDVVARSGLPLARALNHRQTIFSFYTMGCNQRASSAHKEPSDRPRLCHLSKKPSRVDWMLCKIIIAT
eukprot:scaffold368814_cov27-Prasinocladus_malaysianus.AAC.1